MSDRIRQMIRNAEAAAAAARRERREQAARRTDRTPPEDRPRPTENRAVLIRRPRPVTG